MDSAPSAARRRRSDGDPSLPRAEVPSSTPAELNRLDRASTYPPGPSRLRETAVCPPLSPVGPPIPLRRPSATPSIVYSPWDVRLSPIDFSDKGKQRADDDETPADSLSPVATGSIPSSAVSPRDLSDDPPIRIRRIGALGISVASDSEDGDISADPSSIATRSRKRRRGEKVDRDGSSMSSDELKEGDEESTRASSRGMKSKRRLKGVTEVQFRSIVDDLTLENQALKAQLRQYEVGQLPEEVKKERVLEVRYFDGLPGARKEELSDMLAQYVQRLRPSSTTSADSLLAPPPPPRSPNDSPPHLLPRSIHTILRSPSTSPPLPTVPDRPVPRQRRKRDERELLAGPSNSGVEPQSLTGTGSGLRVEDSGRKSKRARLEPTPKASTAAHLDAKDEPRAKELIAVLEKFFEDSIDLPMGAPPSRQPSLASQNGTNEAYLGHLLENDDLSGGWTFLNLVCTMAQIHRFNVTLPFVRSAVMSYSSKLEISADGTKIRWVGPSPQDSSAHRRKQDSARPSLSRSSSSTRSVSTSGDFTTSSSESVTRMSGSGQGSAEASTAATSVSVAPHPSEILHKTRPAPTAVQSLSGHASAPRGGVTETTSSTPSLLPDSSKASAQEEPWAHRYIPCPYRCRDQQLASPPTPNETSSTEKAPGPTGTLIFYADAGFCSDFSKIQSSVSMLPVRPSPVELLGLSSSEVTQDGDADPSPPALLITSLDSVDDLAIIYGAQEAVKPAPSPSSAMAPISQVEKDQELDRFRTATGMTDTTMADLFMMDISTRLSSSPLDTSEVGSQRKAESAFDSTALAAFPAKQSRVQQSIISSTTVYGSPRVNPRRPILLHALSSEDGTLSSESSASSDSPRSRRLVQVGPPSPDYLLSLSLPFFSWAPRETGTAYRWNGGDNSFSKLDSTGDDGARTRVGATQTEGKMEGRFSPDSVNAGDRDMSVAPASSEDFAPIDLDATFVVA